MRRLTREALPGVENYRNMFNFSSLRPTLDELHDPVAEEKVRKRFENIIFFFQQQNEKNISI